MLHCGNHLFLSLKRFSRIIIFHQPRFLWNKGISLPNSHLLGWKKPGFRRYNPTYTLDSETPPKTNGEVPQPENTPKWKRRNIYIYKPTNFLGVGSNWFVSTFGDFGDFGLSSSKRGWNFMQQYFVPPEHGREILLTRSLHARKMDKTKRFLIFTLWSYCLVHRDSHLFSSWKEDPFTESSTLQKRHPAKITGRCRSAPW